MSEAGVPEPRSFVVCGAGRVRFALPAEDVETITAEEDLPPCYRSVDLARLLDMEAGGAERRWARVKGAREPSYLGLGGPSAVATLREEDITPMPAILAVAAARWAWSALALDDENGALVVLDVERLARLGARRERAQPGEGGERTS